MKADKKIDSYLSLTAFILALPLLLGAW